MNKQAHILLCGRDAILLDTRGQVLESAGHRVTSSLIRLQAGSMQDGLALLILCHTLSAEERQCDLTAFTTRFPSASVLCLVPNGGNSCGNVLVLNSYQGPRKMLHVVNELLTAQLDRLFTDRGNASYSEMPSLGS